jgi:hypothetical protein
MRRSSRSNHPADANVFKRKPVEAIADEGILMTLKNSGLNLWESHGAMSSANEIGIGDGVSTNLLYGFEQFKALGQIW